MGRYDAFNAARDDLARAVYSLSRESMSVEELKQAHRDVPGIENLTMGYTPDGKQVVTIAGRSSEVSATATNDEIRVAFQNPFASPFLEPEKPMSIGIQSGAFQAALAKMREELAAHQTSAIAEISVTVEQAGAKMKEAVAGVKAKVHEEVDAALHEFATTTNGGPV